MTKKLGKFLKAEAIPSLLLLFIVVLAITHPSFVSPTNIKNVLIDTGIYGIAAMAMTIAIITGAFDLSMAANFAWGQIFFCWMLNKYGATGLGIFLSFIAMVITTTIVGTINGIITVKTGIPAFITTMGMNYVMKGVCLVFTDSDMISTSNEFVKNFGKSTFLGLSYITWVFVLVALIAFIVMKYTQFGRNLYATGGNPVAAQLSGINIDFYRAIPFTICGLCVGIAAAMYVCEIRAGSVLYGTDLALTCVAATVVGGTPLSGGKGGVGRTVIGILLIYVMYKGLGFLGLDGYMNQLVKGIVLLAVVSFDAYVTQSGTKKA